MGKKGAKLGIGPRQGAILLPVFWAIYCDLMINHLRHLGVGAHVAGMFMGVAYYADDIVRIAPCCQAMQLMLSSVERFAKSYNISFSTDPNPKKSKSKWIFVTGKKRALQKLAPLIVCGNELPWVQLTWDMNSMKVARWTVMPPLKERSSLTNQLR